MSQHAKLFGGSSLHRRFACPGSAKSEAALPGDASSEAAEIGTAAHEVGEMCLTGMAELPSELTGMEASNGVTITETMTQDVAIYVDYCASKEIVGIETPVQYRSAIEKFIGSAVGAQLHGDDDEARNIAADIHALVAGDAFGTADCVAVDHVTDTLYVIDYKNGRGAVDPKENTQLMAYALGAMETIEQPTALAGFHNVVLTIVQPNDPDGETIKEWKTTVDHIYTWAMIDLPLMVVECLRENPKYAAGESRCQYCKAAATCGAHANWVMSLADEEFGDIRVQDTSEVAMLPALGEMGNAQITKALQWEQRLLPWFKRLREYALNEALEGVEFEGQKLVQNLGRRKYTDEAAAERALGRLKLAAKDRREPTKLRSPAQISKLLDGGYDHPFFKKYVERPLNTPKLVPESAKGKPMELVQKEQAEEDFAGI